MAIAHEPQLADVLCGRGENAFRHDGNNYFRELILTHAGAYERAVTKKEKTDVVLRVAYAIIAKGGRFLIRTDDRKSWKDGGLKQGKLKAGHALRDALRGRVKGLAQRKTQAKGEAYTNQTHDFKGEAYTNQIHDFTLKNATCSAFSSQPIYFAVEPSKDWMTASMDAELANFLHTLFFHSESPK